MFLKRKKNNQLNNEKELIASPINNNDTFQIVLKNTGWNIGGGIALLILQLITIPYIISKLGDTQYGIWSLANILLAYFFFLDIGISTACVKYLSEKYNKATPAEINTIFWTALFTTVILGIIASCIMFIISPYIIKRFFLIPDELLNLSIAVLRICSFCLFLTFISGIIKSIPFSLKRFDTINKIQFTTSSILTIGTVLALYYGYGLIQIAELSIFTQLLSIILFSIAAYKIEPRLVYVVPQKNITIKLIKYGSFVFTDNIISPILMHLEKLFIGMFISASMITYYIIPHNLLMRLWLISTGFSTALFPTLSEISYNKNNILISYTVNRAVKLVSAIIGLILLSLFVFADLFLKLWLNESFALSSANVLRVLCIGFWINLISHIIFTFFRAANKPHLPAIFHIIEVIIYIPLAYWLISEYNIIGAAIAWFIRVLIDFILLIISYQIIVKPKNFLLLNSIFNVATLIIFLSIIFSMTLNHFNILGNLSYLLHIIGAFISILIIWYRIFTDEERHLFLKLIAIKKR